MLFLSSVAAAMTLAAPSSSGAVPAGASPTSPARQSAFGVYEGYSEARYDGFRRRSAYVTARDGTRLAVDYYVPTKNGVEANERLPVVFTNIRYMRAWIGPDGKTVTPLTLMPDGIYHDFLQHGYAVVIADVRGSGASFGDNLGLGPRAEATDAFDVIGWIGEQSWAQCNVGMVGRSYMGSIQYLVASTAPPCLKAIVPAVNVFDAWDFLLDGGIARPKITRLMYRAVRSDIGKDSFGRGLPAPVDEDTDGKLRDAAIAERVAGKDPLRSWLDAIDSEAKEPARDRAADGYFVKSPAEAPLVSPSAFLPDVNASGIAVYQVAGWRDAWIRGSLGWFMGLTGPHTKLVVGPWTHAPDEKDDAREAESKRVERIEARRWLDRWVRKIDNGIDREPRVTYAMMHQDTSWEWRTASGWPISTDRTILRAAPNRALEDRRLTPQKPAHYAADLTTTLGPKSRWNDAIGDGPLSFPDLAANDARSLAFTGEPLSKAIEVIGYPIVRIRLSANVPIVNLHVYIADVGPDGSSSYVTEGQLRSSHRALGKAPYPNADLPWPVSTMAAVQSTASLTEGPGDIVFALLPTSYRFEAGRRIRLTIMLADTDNAPVADYPIPPEIEVMLGGADGTVLELPRVR